MDGTSLSPPAYHPQRRRAQQACLNCAKRKTRCDGFRPRCSYCTSQNIDCVYLESHPPRIEPNTQVILDRIHQLENRLFSSPLLQENSPLLSSAHFGGLPLRPGEDLPVPSRGETDALNFSFQSSTETQAPLSHTAGSSYVYELPIVQRLLAKSHSLSPSIAERYKYATPTSIFFQESYTATDLSFPPESWRLFRDESFLIPANSLAFFGDLIHKYFQEVLASLEAVFASEIRQGGTEEVIPPTLYCLLLLVLCLAAHISSGLSLIGLPEDPQTNHHSTRVTPGNNTGSSHLPLHETLWGKAELLLGRVSSETSLESAQCCMLASIYLGSKGHVAGSFRSSHTVATKCEALAKIALSSCGPLNELDDSFRRLYWVAYIWEGDFTSEISVHVPSGMAKYEEHIPYPLFEAESRKLGDKAASKAAELIAFQICTNVSIRRCLSHVNSVLFSSKEHCRINRPSYLNWLLRTTEDLWTHHTAVYRNIPNFLLTSETGEVQCHPEAHSPAFPILPDRNQTNESGNRPWNVTRLNGRYYAGQYIIHRPFIEYVLHNSSQLEAHPLQVAILDRCRVCLEGCTGFIRVFDLGQLNTVTCLFSAGIATFKMVMLMIVATICPTFQAILPPDIEHYILVGKRNMKRFEMNIKHFEWHCEVLERLDNARRSIDS